MVHDPEVTYHIKRCQLATNKNVVDAKKDLETFMQKSLKWCGEMKSMLKKELNRVENTYKKNDHIVSHVMPSKNLSHACISQGTSTSVTNVINIGEAHIHIGNESISCRTRGALKALQSSILAGSLTGSQLETQNTRGLSRIRRKRDDTIVIKRTVEEGDTLGIDSISKKMEKEKLSMIESPKKSEEEVFKKPKPRTRKPKKSKQSESIKDLANELAVEESITFDAVLHSSPNGNARENTFLVSPKNLSVIPKSQAPVGILSLKEEVDCSMTPSSTSNDFISDGEGETAKLGEKFMSEVDVGQKQNKKTSRGRTDRNSKLLGKNVYDIQTNNSSKSDIVINGETTKQIELGNKELNPCIVLNNEELIKYTSSGRETEKDHAKLSEETEEGGKNDDIVDSSESSPAANPGKSSSNNLGSGRAIRETRSVKSDHEMKSSDITSPSEINEDAVLLQDMNSTKVVPIATKRTKPVMKSRIFDSKGNIISSVIPEKKKENSPEIGYSLRSSSFTREVIVKKEILTSDEINTIKPMETKEVSERRSNIENESEPKKTKRTKAKKTGKIGNDASDPVRITRTKSKEAREAVEEAVMRKTGLIEFARKSLNKAKLISLQKDQPKIKQPLASRLAYQKRQISLSKLPTVLKDDILESSNKLNTLCLKKAIVNLGSQVKMSKVQCLKSNENILLTGKGKYQNLFTESKTKYITPAKRCLSPDVSALKSTSKTTKEEEIEKELKLKALKEKEEEAVMKREMAIKMRQKELKEKNEKKLELATKQRKKLEMEKYNCKIQLEREKEEKRKLLLQEREMIKKEKARLKKELMEQKLAETEERRRLEEEARIAKLREQEAEQQRIMLEKQKELERHEKRAQERLAEQKAWENYEMKLKTEQLLRERQQQLAAQLQSANKTGTGKGNAVKPWNYKPRNENDFGLDDEDSDLDSENEGANEEKTRPVPKWAQRVMSKESVVKCLVKKEAMMEYMKCHQKTPDIHKMFKMTPTKRIKRTSSAIWNTPSS